MLLTLLVGIVTFCSIGLAVTIIVPNADAAPAVVNGIYFPVVFISGVFYPLAQGSVLVRIADWFPIFHMIRAMVSAFEGGPGSGLRAGRPGGHADLGSRRPVRHGPAVPVGVAAARNDPDPARRPRAGSAGRTPVP